MEVLAIPTLNPLANHDLPAASQVLSLYDVLARTTDTEQRRSRDREGIEHLRPHRVHGVSIVDNEFSGQAEAIDDRHRLLTITRSLMARNHDSGWLGASFFAHDFIIVDDHVTAAVRRKKLGEVVARQSSELSDGGVAMLEQPAANAQGTLATLHSKIFEQPDSPSLEWESRPPEAIDAQDCSILEAELRAFCTASLGTYFLGTSVSSAAFDLLHDQYRAEEAAAAHKPGFYSQHPLDIVMHTRH